MPASFSGRVRTTIKRNFKRAVLILLPLSVCPILHGLIAGSVFPIWLGGTVTEGTERFLDEMDMTLWSEKWNVPGALSFGQFMDTNNDFYITRINSYDWFAKLGFVLPDQYSPFFLTDPSSDVGIHHLASLDTLMYDTTCPDVGSPDRWLYITGFTYPGFLRELTPWDASFDDVLQYSYTQPSFHNGSFWLAECTNSGFLCEVWHVKYPALLHFHVEDDPPLPDDLAPELSYQTALHNLRPVTVRMIEFPLGSEFTGLSSDVFPSHYEQIKAMATTDGLYEQFEPYSREVQILKRFDEYMDHSFWDNRKSSLHRFNLFENWFIDHIEDPLGISWYSQFLFGVTFVSSIAVVTAVVGIYKVAQDLVEGFLGQPTRGDMIASKYATQNNIFDDLAGGFMSALDLNLLQMTASPTITDEMMSTAAEGFVNQASPSSSAKVTLDRPSNMASMTQ